MIKDVFVFNYFWKWKRACINSKVLCVKVGTLVRCIKRRLFFSENAFFTYQTIAYELYEYLYYKYSAHTHVALSWKICETTKRYPSRTGLCFNWMHWRIKYISRSPWEFLISRRKNAKYAGRLHQTFQTKSNMAYSGLFCENNNTPFEPFRINDFILKFLWRCRHSIISFSREWNSITLDCEFQLRAKISNAAVCGYRKMRLTVAGIKIAALKLKMTDVINL